MGMHSDAEYQAEYDLNTLIDAEKIKGDKKRLKAVMARKKKLMQALEGMGKPGQGEPGYKTSHKT